jgi:hypothetical protein
LSRGKKALAGLLLVCGVLTFLLYGFLSFSSNPFQFWKKVQNPQITVDGRPIAGSVYRRPSGKVLIELAKPYAPYVFFPEYRNTGACDRVRIISIPGYLYAYDFDDMQTPCVALGTSKAEVQANVVVDQSHLEFTSLENKRINVQW